MPRISRWFVKSAMVYLMAALVIGAATAAPGALNLPANVAVLRPTIVHLITVGWLTQMIFGVAYWMFPRASRANPRGSEALATAVYVLLNSGLIARVLAEPAHALRPDARLWGWALAAAGLLQLLAACGFALNTWNRVKAK